MARFENLRVWQTAMANLVDIAREAKDWRGDAGLGQQLLRAAQSVVANIAEGANKGSDREYARYLAIARGSNGEAHAHLLMAQALGLVPDATVRTLAERLDHAGRMLSALITRLR